MANFSIEIPDDSHYEEIAYKVNFLIMQGWQSKRFYVHDKDFPRKDLTASKDPFKLPDFIRFYYKKDNIIDFRWEDRYDTFKDKSIYHTLEEAYDVEFKEEI